MVCFECHTGTNKILNSCTVLCVYFLQGHFAHLVTRCEDIPLVSVTNVYQKYVSYLKAYKYYDSYLVGITA
jgi:hypothetical protein